MDLLTKSDKVKLAILLELRRGMKMSPSMLASKIDCKYETVKKSLAFFLTIKMVKQEISTHGKKRYVHYELTELGKRVVKSA